MNIPFHNLFVAKFATAFFCRGSRLFTRHVDGDMSLNPQSPGDYIGTGDDQTWLDRYFGEHVLDTVASVLISLVVASFADQKEQIEARIVFPSATELRQKMHGRGRCSGGNMLLVETCKRLGINPFEYLKDLLNRLPSAKTSAIYDFLPDRWLAQQKAKSPI